MAKRDPKKTAINKQIKEMKAHLQSTQDHVMVALNEPTIGALHGRVGGKNAEFIDIKNEVIRSAEEYVAFWVRGFLEALKERRPLTVGDSYYDMFLAMREDPIVKDYITTFLRRTYLKNHESLSRVRPRVEDAEIWIGQNHASYGILVTPRFVRGIWENDKSEIRHFSEDYWTIGHVLETGMVVPKDPDRVTFANVENYLTFFKNTLVRGSGSSHEKAIADRYVAYVRAHSEPTKVPLLIPEFRYKGLEKDHKYRLDFTVIDPHSMQKIGFEF